MKFKLLHMHKSIGWWALALQLRTAVLVVAFGPPWVFSVGAFRDGACRFVHASAGLVGAFTLAGLPKVEAWQVALQLLRTGMLH